MSFQIDAWLERTNPSMRIIDIASGVIVARFNASEIHELCERGEFCPRDFCDECPEARKSLAQQLLLAAFARELLQPVAMKSTSKDRSAETAKIYLFPL